MPRYTGYAQGSGRAVLCLGTDEMHLIGETPHTALDCIISVGEDGQDHVVITVIDVASMRNHVVYSGRLSTLWCIEQNENAKEEE